MHGWVTYVSTPNDLRAQSLISVVRPSAEGAAVAGSFLCPTIPFCCPGRAVAY